MPELSNVDILENVMHGLFTTTGRRTSENYAVAVIYTITRALKKRFDFLKYIKFNIGGDIDELITISPQLNSIDPTIVGRAVESIIQVIFMDLKDKAGFYFINEFKKNTGEVVISDLKEVGVDLELLQIQQHYLYRQRSRIKSKSKTAQTGDLEPTKEKIMIDYSWENVSNWDYDANNRSCIIYDKKGTVLDQLNLDDLLKQHIKYLTETDSVELPTDYKMEEKEKSLKLKKSSH